MIRAAVLALPILSAALLLASCSAPLPVDDRQLGVVEGISVVAPGFTVEASPVLEEGLLRLEVRAALSRRDLAFVRRDDGYVAPIELWFRVRDRTGRETLAAREVSDSLTVHSPQETQLDHQLVFAEVFEVPPGRMIAEVMLRDARGEARATRRFEAQVPGREDAPVILPPRLLRGEAFAVGAHIERWRMRDDVRVTIELFDPENAVSGASMAVVRARSDTSVATPPYWISPSRASMAYRGVIFDGDGTDTVMVARTGVGAIELPLLDEGAYVIVGWSPAVAITVRRPLLVVPESHPRVETIDDLVDALAYIAYPAEIEQMTEAGGSSERRARFDAFWGTLFDARAVAEETMRLYYERVEEANRLFTSHKPGWMTDRGMIYIVHGVPDLVERSLDGEVWRYAYGRGGSSEAYFFERVPYEGSPWPLFHHVLQRSQRYEPDWQRAIRRWRQGDVR